MIPRRDENAAVIVWVKKYLAGVAVGVAAGYVAQLVADDFLKTNFILRGIDVAVDGGDCLESGFGIGSGRPDMHLLAVPAKESLVGTKEDAFGSNQRLPYVCEVAILDGDFVEQRDKMQRAGGVWREVTEVRASTDPDGTGVVDCKGTCDGGRGEDLSPGDSVVFKDGATGIAEVHDAATVLEDRPGPGQHRCSPWPNSFRGPACRFRRFF